MANDFDFSTDWLADAPLNSEQRRAWNALRNEMVSLRVKNRELEEKLQEFERQQTDAEPSILNRPEFNREVARMLAFDERYGGVSSVLYFDFENFDETVSRYGRAVANAAIREIGTIISHSVRNSDIVGRLAPDEFGVLLMRCDNAAAWTKAESLGTELQQALATIHDCKLNVKVSYGAYTFHDNEDLAAGLKEAARTMMNAVK